MDGLVCKVAAHSDLTPVGDVASAAAVRRMDLQPVPSSGTYRGVALVDDDSQRAHGRGGVEGAVGYTDDERSNWIFLRAVDLFA